MMKFFRKNKKKFATLAIISIVNQIILPTIALANNGGEVNAEYSKGGGVGNDLVNMYNGAFNYKVDLLTLPGSGVSFPISISYNTSDVNMLSIPTCVGEGWSLNIPKITRQVKAVPDDFKGDLIQYDFDMKPMEQFMIDLSKANKNEIYGLPNLWEQNQQKVDSKGELIVKLGWDNYSGIRYVVGYKTADKKIPKSILKLNSSFILDSKYGLSVNPSLTFESKKDFESWYGRIFAHEGKLGAIGLNGSVRSGFNGLTLSGGSMMNFSYGNSGVPMVDMPTITNSYKFTGNLGIKPSKFIGGGVDSAKFTAVRDIFFNDKKKKKLGILNGSYSQTKLSENRVKRGGFGMLYKDYVTKNGVKDFLRHNLDVNKNVPFLPTSQIGKDVFIQSGGYGGVFMVDNNEVTTWGTTKNTSKTIDLGFAAEYGSGAGFQAGVDMRLNKGESKSGKWKQSEIAKELNHINRSRKNLKSSEVDIDDRFNMYTTWQGTDPVAPVINKEGLWGTTKRGYVLENSFVKDVDDIKDGAKSDVLTSTSDYLSKKDAKKLKYVQYLTTEEAAKYGHTKDTDYMVKNGSNPSRQHHIAEINVFERDQSVLRYGEPVYNIKKVDANFSLDTKDGNLQTKEDKLNLNQYEYDLNGSKNVNVNDELLAGSVGSEILTKVTTPEYATSWLIQDIPSKDYEDVDNDGKVSSRDKGDCIHFDYFTPQNNEVYKWRFPYENVDVMQGVKDYPRDNMASYSYGENELKYVKTIETKTHYVNFIYDKNYTDYYPNANPNNYLRKDGYPVDNELYGGINSSASGFEKTWRLMEIRLYIKDPDGTKKINKDDFIQKVVLEQDYALCQDHPSNIDGEGKLTLQKVYSTYRYSPNGQHYKYEFNYGSEVKGSIDNPNFNRFNVDRWGDYQNNSIYDVDKTIPEDKGTYPYKELPYTNQGNDEGINPAPWCIKSILLPSGADLKIAYEKNDYAYVEDKESTQMYDIIGTEKVKDILNDLSINANRDPVVLYNVEIPERFKTASIQNKNKIVVKLDKAVFSDILTGTKNEWNTRFYKKYIEGIEDELFISAYTKLEPDGTENLERSYDWTNVVAQVEKDKKNKRIFEVVKVGSDFYGQISLVKKIGIPFNFNPIRAAGFETLKQKRRDLLNGQPNSVGSLNGLIGEGLLFNIFEFLSPTNVMAIKHASEIRLNGWSKIRLKNPFKKKQGGGYRVKTITLDDNWKNDTNQPTVDDNYSYILEYDYSAYDKRGNYLGSSGVATEPFNGNKENANWNLITYKKSAGWLVEPMHVNIYGSPLDNIANGGPGVGYESVIIKTKFPSNVTKANVLMSQPPCQKYQFYSAREFPTIKRHTKVFTEAPYVFPVSIQHVMDIKYKERGYSQGYTAVTNDMAGKLKSLYTYDRNNNIINGQEYFYNEAQDVTDDYSYVDRFMKSNLNSTKRVKSLKNSVLLVGKNDKLKKGQLGISEEVWIDLNENNNELKSAWYQFDINVYNQVPFITPLLAIPIVHHDESEKTAVAIKKIHKSGILTKVKTVKDESIIYTKYHAYDELTGRVVLSSVENEFGDPIYKYSKSGYNQYEGFNRVEESIDIIKDNFTISNSVMNAVQSSVFKEGDYLAAKKGNSWDKYYVRKLSSGKAEFLQEDTDIPVSSATFDEIRVLKSGNTNLVDASVGEIVSQKIWISNYHHLPSPIPLNFLSDGLLRNDDLNYINDGISQLQFKNNGKEQVLNVSAVTFKSDWNKDCCSGLLNPYRNGLSNYWRPYQSFVYHGERDYNTKLKNRSRESGIIKNYEPFDWTPNIHPKTPSAWVLSSEATFFDANGNLLEQKDALGLYSSSGYGFGNNLVEFVSGNSNHTESGSDSFEDYEFYRCTSIKDFSFYSESVLKNMIDWEYSHSGKMSLKLQPSESVKMKVNLQNCSSGQ